MGRGYPRERIAPFFCTYLWCMFLQRLFRHSKLAGIIFLIFCLGHMIAAFRTVESFPFLLYGMYSQPIQAIDSVNAFDIRIDGVSFHPKSDLEKQLIYSPIKSYFSKSHQTWNKYYSEKLDFNAPENYPTFLADYKSYLSDILRVEKQRISIFRLTITPNIGIIHEEEITP